MPPLDAAPSAGPAPAGSPHTPFEDAQALATGVLLVAFGVTLFARAGLLTGGTAGIAFLIHYATGWRFGPVFFALNLPFYGMAWRQMGRAFALKTFAAVGLLSIATELLPLAVGFAQLDAGFAALMGGCLIGVGLLILFRHHASLGGLNVLVLWLQTHYGLRAGKIQMALDCTILLASFAVLDALHSLLSIAAAVEIGRAHV